MSIYCICNLHVGGKCPKISYGSFGPRFGSSCMWTFYETRPAMSEDARQDRVIFFRLFPRKKKKGRKCMSCRRGEGKETILVVVLHGASSSGSGICVWDVAPKIERENQDDGDQDDDSVIVTIFPPFFIGHPPPSTDGGPFSLLPSLHPRRRRRRRLLAPKSPHSPPPLTIPPSPSPKLA